MKERELASASRGSRQVESDGLTYYWMSTTWPTFLVLDVGKRLSDTKSDGNDHGRFKRRPTRRVFPSWLAIATTDKSFSLIASSIST